MGKNKDKNLEKDGDKMINQISELSGIDPKLLKKRGNIENISNVEGLEEFKKFFQPEQYEEMKKFIETHTDHELKIVRFEKPTIITSTQKTRFIATSNLINVPDKLAPVFQTYPDLKEIIDEIKVIKVKIYGPKSHGNYKIKGKLDTGKKRKLFKDQKINDYDISRVSGNRIMYPGNFDMINALTFDEVVNCRLGIDENSAKMIIQFYPIEKSEIDQ